MRLGAYGNIADVCFSLSSATVTRCLWWTINVLLLLQRVLTRQRSTDIRGQWF